MPEITPAFQHRNPCTAGNLQRWLIGPEMTLPFLARFPYTPASFE
jgi:hypothetical protein